MPSDDALNSFFCWRLCDPAEPIEDRPPVNLTPAGLDALRRRALAQTLPDTTEFARARASGPIYLDEVLALIDQVAQMRDGLERIANDTHFDRCEGWEMCECDEQIAMDALGLLD